MIGRAVRSACSALALVAGLVASAQAPAPASVEFNHPLGLQMYTLRFVKGSLADKLALVQKLGLKEIEGGVGGSPAEARALFERYGLKCTSIGASYEQVQKDIDKIIANAKGVGASYVMVAWIPHNGDFTEEGVHRAAADFNAWGKKFKENGIKFCYHTHGYEFRRSGDGTLFDLLMKETNPEEVFYEMDVFWVAHSGTDPIHLLKQYPQRFRLMHLKDLQKGFVGDFTGHAPDETSVPLGEGQIDYPTLLKVAQDAGVERYYIEDEAKDAVDHLPLTLRFLTAQKF